MLGLNCIVYADGKRVNIKEYRRKLRQAQQELKVFVEEHNEMLHRDYDREKYYGGGVDKNEKYGIMNAGSEAMYRKTRAGYIEPMPKKQTLT